MVSSTGLMEGSARAFPAWPNEQEVIRAGGGRERGRGLDQNDPHCWIWAIKGSRSWRYKCFSPSEFGCTLLQDCCEALTILSQELGRVKGLLSTNLNAQQTHASRGLLFLFMCSHRPCNSTDWSGFSNALSCFQTNLAFLNMISRTWLDPKASVPFRVVVLGIRHSLKDDAPHTCVSQGS